MNQATLRRVERSSMDKSKALDAALSQIERNFGKGSIMRLGKNDRSMDVETISIGLARARLRPRNRRISPRPRRRDLRTGVERQDHSHAAAIAQVQRQLVASAAFIDAEHALDINYARKLGRGVEELLISQPDNGEQALEIAETLVRSGVIVVSSSTLLRRSFRRPSSRAIWATAYVGPPGAAHEPGAAQAHRLRLERIP